MHEFDHEDAARHRPARDTATRAAAAPEAAGRGSAGALDAASVLHLQRTAGNASVVQLLGIEEEATSPVLDVVGKGGGTPLDHGTRSSMEQAFGQSFGDVRVHTDARASRSAEAVGANAYTVGSDIVFRNGHFDPGSPTGQRTLAHELTHVVQQREGPVDGSDAPGGIRVSDPGDRFERAADASADRALASVQAPATTAPAASAAVQREEDPSLPPVQRETAPEEEEEMQA